MQTTRPRRAESARASLLQRRPAAPLALIGFLSSHSQGLPGYRVILSAGSSLEEAVICSTQSYLDLVGMKTRGSHAIFGKAFEHNWTAFGEDRPES